jgi:bla regulator protein blaR1
MRIVVAIVLAIASAGIIRAQNPAPEAAVEFEAASIKLNKSGGETAGLRRFPGGRLEVTNMPLAFLIEFAYQLQNYELHGGPAWLTSDRWDIIAKIAGDPPPAAPGTGTPDSMMLATRRLLAERFKLAVHRDTRDADV